MTPLLFFFTRTKPFYYNYTVTMQVIVCLLPMCAPLVCLKHATQCNNKVFSHFHCYVLIVIVTVCTILHSRSVGPRKWHVDVKYYIAHMYSMPYYTYGSAANFLFLGPTALIYTMYIERTAL